MWQIQDFSEGAATPNAMGTSLLFGMKNEENSAEILSIINVDSPLVHVLHLICARDRVFLRTNPWRAIVKNQPVFRRNIFREFAHI